MLVKERTPILPRVLGLLKVPELALWLAFLLLTPFYAWRSGLPQPADGVLVALLVYLAWKGLPPLPRALRASFVAILTFATYAALVNLTWGVLLIDYEVRKVGAIGFAAFYLFNALVFGICVILYQRIGVRFVAVTAWGAAAALLMQLVLFAVRGDSGLFREKLYFNNPNQLGYYALLSAAIVAFAYQRARMPIVFAGAALATATLFAASSLSKAALIGTAVMAGVAAIRKPVLVIVTAMLLLVGVGLRNPSELVERVSFRMQDMGRQGDDTLEGRGYSRIELHPQYLALGAGEVGHDRHGDFGGELHSSWATVLFSYGVVGTAALLVFFWHALRHLRPLDWLFPLPIFVYGITHQGLRFRLFWVFIGLMCVAAYHARVVAARQARIHRTQRALGRK